MIRFQCERCGKSLAIKQARAGAVVTCPGCKKSTRISESLPAPEEGVEDSGDTLPFSRSGMLKGLIWFLSIHLIAILMMVGAPIGCLVIILKEPISFQMILGLVFVALAGVVGFCYFVMSLPNWRLFLFSTIPSSSHYLVTGDRLVRYSRAGEVVEEVPFANIISVRLLIRRSVENPEVTARVLGIDLRDPDDDETMLDRPFCRWSEKMHRHDLVMIEDFFEDPIKTVFRTIKKRWQQWQETHEVPEKDDRAALRPDTLVAWYQKPLTYVVAGVGLLGVLGLIGLVALVSFLGQGKDSGKAAGPSTAGVQGAAQGGPDGERSGAGGQAGSVAYWPLDDGPGKTVNDASGNGSTGRVHGGEGIQGVKGSAVRLKARGDFVDLGTQRQLDFGASASFTIAGWVTTQGNGVICSFRRQSSPFPVIELSVRQGRLAGWVRDDTSGIGGARVSGGPVNDGSWHHVALLRQGDGTIELFLDGTSQGNARGTNSGGPITTDLRTLGCDRFLLTQNKAPGYLLGSFDEFCVYNRALTPAEISTLAGRK